MRPVGLAVPSKFQIFLCCIFALSWFSGISFLLLDLFFEIEGEFGPEKHPFLTPALNIHGGSAFLAMMCFGAMLAAHIPLGWRTGRLRILGIGLVGSVAFQIITAYLLYYSGGEMTQFLAKWAHVGVGVFIPLFLTLHIRKAKRLKRERKKNRKAT